MGTFYIDFCEGPHATPDFTIYQSTNNFLWVTQVKNPCIIVFRASLS